MPAGVKASIAFFIASVITSGISYIVTPIYTRLLSPDEYGQVSVYMTWMQIFGIVAMFCLSYGVFNNGMIDHPDKRDEFSFSMLILSNIITLAFSAILLGLYPLIKELLNIELPYLILMCVLFFVQPAYNFWTARQRYELKYKKVVIFSIMAAVLSPLVAILCIIFAPNNKLFARIFGAEITLIIIYIAFYVYLAVKSKGKVNVKYWKFAILFNLPLIPHYLSTYMLSNSDKLMISYLVGDTATAYYSIAYSVAAIALIVWSAVNSSLIPYTYEKCKVKDYNAIAKITIPILMIFAVISVMVIMMAPEVVAVLGTQDYQEAIYAIPPIVGGVFFQVQYYIYANIVYYYKKPKYVMIGSVVAMLLNIILNYFCIKQFGYIAAGYTTLGCYFIQATIDFIAMRKVVGQNVYNMKLIGLFSIIVICISLVSNFIYDFIFVRYGIILVFILLAIVFRKRIIGFFKQLRENKADQKLCSQNHINENTDANNDCSNSNNQNSINILEDNSETSNNDGEEDNET